MSMTDTYDEALPGSLKTTVLLSQDNYDKWQDQMEYLLNKAKLLWVIDEVTECPDDVKESPDFKRLFHLIMKSGNLDFKLFQMK